MKSRYSSGVFCYDQWLKPGFIEKKTRRKLVSHTLKYGNIIRLKCIITEFNLLVNLKKCPFN